MPAAPVTYYQAIEWNTHLLDGRLPAALCWAACREVGVTLLSPGPSPSRCSGCCLLHPPLPPPPPPPLLLLLLLLPLLLLLLFLILY